LKMPQETQPRCLVLGGKGFIGSHLIDALLRQGMPVTVFDRANIPPLNGAGAAAQVQWIDGDFISDADLGRALAGCGVCFHLVSTTLPQSSNADPVFDVETNIAGTIRLLNHAVREGVKKIVFISSGGTVYGIPRSVPIGEDHPTNPICSYGITKLAIEKYLHLYLTLHGLDYTVLRLSNPFGERQRIHASQGAVAVFMGKVLRGEKIEIWGDGSVVRDYVYIGDAVDAMVKAATYRGEERVFNIGSGTGVNLNQILDGIEQVTGRKADRKYTAARAFDVPVSILACDRARAALGWAATTPFTEGLRKLMVSMKTEAHNAQNQP
jgi:UDP-glucose 4-epimerase